MERIYGNTATSLTLNRLACIVYRDSDPLTITEYDSDTGPLYRLSGIIEADNLTADDVNDILTDEEMLDAYDEYEFVPNEDSEDYIRDLCDIMKRDTGIDLEYTPGTAIRLADLRAMSAPLSEIMEHVSEKR